MHLHGFGIEEHTKIIVGSYSPVMIIISLIFACVMSFAAIKINLRANNVSFFHKHFWYVLASLALAYAIWSMHYVGMLAFSLPLEISYKLVPTIISIFPALIATFFAFNYVSKPKKQMKNAFISSVLMGVAVCSMHFIGMYSMQVNATHSYNIWGLLVALITSGIGFFIFSMSYKYIYKRIIQITMGIIIGSSVAITHYVAMLSMEFHVEHSLQLSGDIIVHSNREQLTSYLFLGMLVVIVFLILMSLADRVVEQRAKKFDPHTHLPNINVFKKHLDSGLYEQLIVWHLNFYDTLNKHNGYLKVEEQVKLFVDFLRFDNEVQLDIYRVNTNQIAILNPMKNKGFKEIIEKKQQQLYNESILNSDTSVLCVLVEKTDQIQSKELYDRASDVIKLNANSNESKFIQYDIKVHNNELETIIINDLAAAMAEPQLHLVFQPKIHPQTNYAVGYEALLRWQHPTAGFLSPGMFIPILEKENKMQEVTDWIIDQVGQQIVQWEIEGKESFQVAINIPGNYVTSPKLIAALERMIQMYKINPKHIELEITETSFVKNIREAENAVSAFREMGFSVALDDFGTGLSSLSYLKRMRISTLKIDKSFVDGVPHLPKDASILEAIITLGESLNLKVVIEGVETIEQVDYIRSISESVVIQGYYYSKPISPEEISERYLKEQIYS